MYIGTVGRRKYKYESIFPRHPKKKKFKNEKICKDDIYR